MASIIIDQRERNSGIARELTKKEISIKFDYLSVADFVIQTKDMQGNMQNLAVERKTQNDFINSIIDKRIMNQLIELKNHFSLQLLVIEGSKNIYTIRNFNPNAIRGMLASIAIDFNVPIIYTRNMRDTASLLAIIAKRLEKPRRNISLLFKKKPLTLKEQQEYLVESLPGIGPSLAKALLKKFKSIRKLANAKESALQKVEKIGPKKAKTISRVLEGEYS